MATEKIDVERSVGRRYSAAAGAPEPALCCAVDYDARLLDVIPREIIERDYGCGNPTEHLRPGETVLDLGSGGGKACFIAAQVVGPTGRVIGVDMNGEMLQLAESCRERVGDALGYHNVTFLEGRIQDLALDGRRLARRLAAHPVCDTAGLTELEDWKTRQRAERPMIADASIDVVISNCVLNLVRPADKAALFAEIWRVLRPGGRAVISDIVCDEDVPSHLQADPELWSGCISGAFREDRFVEAFEQAGLYGMRLLARDTEPWQVVEGIEFRSVTVEAFRGKDGPCLEHGQAVIYRGPWRSVTDDDGRTLHRGTRSAVCDKTFRTLTRAPYAADVLPVEPLEPIAPDVAREFDCSRDAIRDPRETKGRDYTATRRPDAPCCGPGNDCDG